MNNNITDFDELCKRLYNENYKELEKLRKTDKHNTIKFIIIMTIGIIGVIFYFPLFVGMIIFALVVAIISCLVNLIKDKSLPKSNVKNPFIPSESYKKSYQEKIISPIINYTLTESEYLYNMGIEEKNYKICEWGKYTDYSSDNKITTPIILKKGDKKNLELAMVHTSCLERMPDGERGVPTVEFDGLFGIIKLPININCSIKMIKKTLGTTPTNKIKIDIEEFDKKFYLLTDNKEIAKKIFTTDIVIKILDFIKNNNCKLEILIKNDMLYVRFHIKNYFEPVILKESIDYNILKLINSSIKNITCFIESMSNDIIEKNQ